MRSFFLRCRAIIVDRPDEGNLANVRYPMHDSAMPSRSIAICVAIQLEADAIANALPPQLPVQLHVVGIGAVRLPRIDPEEVRLVVSAGLAGALDPSLRCGDVV